MYAARPTEHRRLLLPLLLALAGASVLAGQTGCQQVRTVDIFVSNRPADVNRLSVTAGLDQVQPIHVIVQQVLDHFILRLPADATGTVQIGIKGLDDQGCQIAEWTGSALLAA